MLTSRAIARRRGRVSQLTLPPRVKPPTPMWETWPDATADHVLSPARLPADGREGAWPSSLVMIPYGQYVFFEDSLPVEQRRME